jgi:hypothetical protein
MLGTPALTYPLYTEIKSIWVQSDSRKKCSSGSGCSFYRALSRQVQNNKCKSTFHTNNTLQIA